MNKTYIGIDPSVNSLGLAVLQGGDTLRTWTLTSLGSTPQKKAIWIVKNLVRQIAKYNSNETIGIIEYPNFQTNSRGIIAAQKGYVADLAFVCGLVVGQLSQISWSFPTPNKWKGNQTKEAIGLKFRKWWPNAPAGISDHEYEAAMMIKWYIDNENKRIAKRTVR